MGKIDKIENVALADLKPYAKNAKIHGDRQIEKIAVSINEFGFISPILIDKKKNIIAGHGRVEAAKKLGLDNVPAVYIEGLTAAQRRAYILADNRLTELGEWDLDMVDSELDDLAGLDFDTTLTGFDDDKADHEWFASRERYDNSNDENESEEYREFIEKFEPKRTTDDCYTPDEVYDVIADYVTRRYGLKRETFIRPFYPGGDYKSEKYEGRVVVDNPPFSILSEIIRYYIDNRIGFFVFCPGLTPISSSSAMATIIAANATITYENGAEVSTSFITNLEPCDVAIRSCPELYDRIKAACEDIRAEHKKQLPVYSYPDEVVTSTMMNYLSAHHVEHEIKKNDCQIIDALDEQREVGKVIFGKGFLLSEKATAEKSAAEKRRQRMPRRKKRRRTSGSYQTGNARL